MSLVFAGISGHNSFQMNRRFLKYLKIVASCHIGLVVVLLTTSGWTGIFDRKQEETTRMEFCIAVEGAPVPHGVMNFVEPVKEKKKPPADPGESTLASIKSDTGSWKKKTIEISRKKIVRSVDKPRGGGGAPRTNLSPEQIKRFLAEGARMSDHDYIPDDDEVRCKAIIKNTMDEAWNQPSKEDTGDVSAEATIGLSRDGRVTWRKLSKKSGNALFDESVMQAVTSVEAIQHLTPGFLDKFHEAKVTFKFE